MCDLWIDLMTVEDEEIEQEKENPQKVWDIVSPAVIAPDDPDQHSLVG